MQNQAWDFILYNSCPGYGIGVSSKLSLYQT
jgi:hypothetical protein